MKGLWLSTVLLVAVGGLAQADIKIQDWRFDNDAPGSFPAGFIADSRGSQGGRWEITLDPKAPSPPNVLANTNGDGTDQQPRLIFLADAEAGNLDLTVRIKALSGGEGQGGGIIFRALDDRSYYVVWLSPQEKLLRLERVVDGRRKTLQDLKVETAEVDRWHTLRLSIRGPLLEAVYDSRHVLSAREDAWQHGVYKKGKLGLWAQGSAATQFDNLRVTAMDEGTGSGPLGGTESTIVR